MEIDKRAGVLARELHQRALKLLGLIKAYYLPITAAILLIIAVVLALIDRVAAGSLVATLFVVLALFHFLPQMESFKAFGIEAKWRERLREAEDILDKLRRSTIASAEFGYFMLGWGSRMGGPRSKERQALADQMDSVLNELNVDREKLAALKRDYLFFASYDLFQTFDAIVSLNIRTNRLQPRPSIDLLEELPKAASWQASAADVSSDGITVRRKSRALFQKYRST
jgi:hypothetical protein